MRHKILGMTMGLALVTGQFCPAAEKGPKPDVGVGRIAWFDITTTNLALSKEFYGKLFDWEFTSLKGTNLAAEIVSRGTGIGTLRVAEGKINRTTVWSMSRWPISRPAAEGEGPGRNRRARIPLQPV